MTVQNLAVRRATLDDVPGLTPLVAALEMFPPDMLPEMIENPEGVFLTLPTPLGFLYAAPEPLTEGTWNMLALGVSPDHQRTGVGRALTDAAVDILAKRGGRLLIVDTSGTPAFEAARAFYAGHGFSEVAVIPDYWAPGDDKVVFAKPLL